MSYRVWQKASIFFGSIPRTIDTSTCCRAFSCWVCRENHICICLTYCKVTLLTWSSRDEQKVLERIEAIESKLFKIEQSNFEHFLTERFHTCLSYVYWKKDINNIIFHIFCTLQNLKLRLEINLKSHVKNHRTITSLIKVKSHIVLKPFMKYFTNL